MGEDFRHLRTAAEANLRAAQRAIAEEIASYPTPISGCDAQFNHLIAERSRIAASLAALSREVFVPTPRQPSPEMRVESR